MEWEPIKYHVYALIFEGIIFRTRQKSVKIFVV